MGAQINQVGVAGVRGRQRRRGSKKKPQEPNGKRNVKEPTKQTKDKTKHRVKGINQANNPLA